MVLSYFLKFLTYCIKCVHFSETTANRLFADVPNMLDGILFRIAWSKALAGYSPLIWIAKHIDIVQKRRNITFIMISCIIPQNEELLLRMFCAQCVQKCDRCITICSKIGSKHT